MSEPLAIVGDVHGDATKLRRMVTALPLGRRVVMVGDYVDRGADSREVIDILIEWRSSLGTGLVLLAGNHEIELLRFFDDGDFARYARHGGMSTIRSYVGTARGDVLGQFRSAFPESHLDFLRHGLATHHESDDVLISHVGYDPGRPSDRSMASMVLEPHPEILRPGARPKTTVVVGHYVQTAPYVTDGLICVDTGCGTSGGPLTAVLLPEHEFISIN